MGMAAIACAKAMARATTSTVSPLSPEYLRERYVGDDERVFPARALLHPREARAIGRPRRQDRVLRAGDRRLVLIPVEEKQPPVAIGERDRRGAGRSPSEHQSGYRWLVDELAHRLPQEHQAHDMELVADRGAIDIGRSDRRVAAPILALDEAGRSGAVLHGLERLRHIDEHRSDARRKTIRFVGPVVLRP